MGASLFSISVRVCVSLLFFLVLLNSAHANDLENALTVSGFELANKPTEFLAQMYAQRVPPEKRAEYLKVIRRDFEAVRNATTEKDRFTRYIQASEHLSKMEIKDHTEIRFKVNEGGKTREERADLFLALLPNDVREKSYKGPQNEKAFISERMTYEALRKYSQENYAKELAKDKDFAKESKERMKAALSGEDKEDFLALERIMTEFSRTGDAKLTSKELRKILDKKLAGKSNAHIARHLQESESIHKAVLALIDLTDKVVPDGNEGTKKGKQVGVAVLKTFVEGHELLHRMKVDNTFSRLAGSADMVTLGLKLGVELINIANETKPPEEVMNEKLDHLIEQGEEILRRQEMGKEEILAAISRSAEQDREYHAVILKRLGAMDRSIEEKGFQLAQTQRQNVGDLVAPLRTPRETVHALKKSLSLPAASAMGRTEQDRLNAYAQAIIPDAGKEKMTGCPTREQMEREYPIGAIAGSASLDPGRNLAEAIDEFKKVFRDSMQRYLEDRGFSPTAQTFALGKRDASPGLADSSIGNKFAAGHSVDKEMGEVGLCGTPEPSKGHNAKMPQTVSVDRAFFRNVYDHFIPDSLKALQAVDGGRLKICIDNVSANKMDPFLSASNSRWDRFTTHMVPNVTLKIEYEENKGNIATNSRMEKRAFRVELNPEKPWASKPDFALSVTESLESGWTPEMGLYKSKGVFDGFSQKKFYDSLRIRGFKGDTEKYASSLISRTRFNKFFGGNVGMSWTRWDPELEFEASNGQKGTFNFDSLDDTFAYEALKNLLPSGESGLGGLSALAANEEVWKVNQVQKNLINALVNSEVDPIIESTIRSFFRPGAKPVESNPEVYRAANRLIGAYKLYLIHQRIPPDGKADERIDAILSTVQSEGNMGKFAEQLDQFRDEALARRNPLCAPGEGAKGPKSLAHGIMGPIQGTLKRFGF